ncbi:MAG TPA: hypothetical protein VHL11_11550, partial [Phototrophicaceae bacterium]|nr:hypothetical protein [Phototrophicaceae bacterium]
MSRLILFLTVCILCSACVPAQIPPQLTFTPAAPLIITDHQVNFGTFQVNYPEGWRVITGPGNSVPLTTFVDPDEIGLIQVV